MPLPVADAATRAYFVGWLERFAGYVRDVNYAAARPLFHPDILAFGTHRDIIEGVASWQATQWDNVWPKTADFRFVIDQASILASSDGTMATVIAPWTSTAPPSSAQSSVRRITTSIVRPRTLASGSVSDKPSGLTSSQCSPVTTRPDASTTLRMFAASAVEILSGENTGFTDTVDYDAIAIGDGLVILSWQEHIGSTIVHVLDMNANDAHTFVTPAKGGFMRLNGRIKVKGAT